MNRTSWPYGILCLIFVFQGCAEEGSDVGDVLPNSPDASVVYPGTPDGAGPGFPSFPDVGTEGGGEDVDAGTPEEDSSESPDTENPVEDVEEEDDASTEGGEEDVTEPDATQTEEDTEETDTSSGGEEGSQGPAEVGEPCTPEYGCVEGASCIEVEDGGIETICFEDVGEGGPCGPGFGQCEDGFQCLTQEDGSKACIQIIEEGGDCSAPGVTCPAGQLCLPSGDILGYESTGGFPGGGTGTGSLHWDDAGEILWVSDSAGGTVRGLSADGTVLHTVQFPEGTSEIPSPDGLFFGGDLLWIADPANHTIWSASAPDYLAVSLAEGVGLFGVDGPKDVLWRLVGEQPQILSSSPSLSVIQTLAANGDIGPTLGSEDVLTTPMGLWDWGGGIWVADAGSQQITVLDNAGLILLEYGGPDEAGGNLVAPEDIALVASGDMILLADPAGGQVVVYDFDGVVMQTLTGPEGWTPVALTVAADGSAIFVLDGATGEVGAYGATYGSFCVSPGAAGDPCGEEGDVPCADGLTCAPVFEGSQNFVCKGELAEGASCDVANAVCPEGTECVRGNAATKHEKLCLTQVEIGEPCGPGVAGCVDGAGCNWDGPLHQSRTCYADIPEGSICNGYATGDCAEGTSCVLDLPGSTVKVCRAFAGEGETCDVLAGVDCDPGLSCNYSTSIQDRACFPFQPAGSVCGIGVGDCEAGTSCQFPSATALAPICIPNSIIGEECATEGKGLCDDNATCILSAATGPAFCAENVGEEADSCGAYGMDPCSAGTECLVDEVGGSTASCYQDEDGENDLCGVQFGFCDEAEGLACSITDSDNLTGTCRPHAPDYGPCGSLEEGTPGCGLFTHTCTCSNPFLEMTSYDPAVCQAGGYKEVCVPNVELYDFCASNTALVGTEAELGWIGLCPNDLVCSGAVGYSFGELLTSNDDPVTSLFFQCKPTVGIGQACGQRSACESGLTCLCGADTPCTIYESMVGDQGVCGVSAP